MPLIFALAARLENILLPNFVSNPTKIANNLVALYQRLRPDGVTCYFDLFIVAEALGCRLDWSARNVYKVVYDPDTMRSNRKETEELRQAERQARLARGKTWDDFMEEWSQLKPPEDALTWFGSWPDGAVVAPVFRP